MLQHMIIDTDKAAGQFHTKTPTARGGQFQPPLYTHRVNLHHEPAEGRGQPPGISSVLSWRFTEKPTLGDQATLHPHPRVTAVAKTRNRRAACPLPQLSGRGILEAVRDPSSSFALLTSLVYPWVFDSSRTMKIEGSWSVFATHSTGKSACECCRIFYFQGRMTVNADRARATEISSDLTPSPFPKGKGAKLKIDVVS